jgi:hypothetical protein
MPDAKIFQSGLSPKVGKNPFNSESDRWWAWKFLDSME